MWGFASVMRGSLFWIVYCEFRVGRMGLFAAVRGREGRVVIGWHCAGEPVKGGTGEERAGLPIGR